MIFIIKRDLTHKKGGLSVNNKIYVIIDEYTTDTKQTTIILCKDKNTLKEKFENILKEELEFYDEIYDEFDSVWNEEDPTMSYIYRHNNISNTNIHIEEKEIL